MAERFYINCPLAQGLVVVEGPEAHHLATVCRLRAGDQVCLFNGDGRQYPALILEVAKRKVTLHVQNVEAPVRELGFHLEIAAPLPKGDRAQFLVEKLTELGVTTFVPLHTARSVVHPRDTKLEKLERYVIEASKQCGRNVLMKISGVADWKTYAHRDDLPGLKILAHPGGIHMEPAAQARDFNPQPAAQARDIVAAVGPEGGFTEEEVEIGRAAGWKVVDLGQRILRVETAAMALAVLASGMRIES